MSASEPVMDAVEKVARVLYEMRLAEHGPYTAAHKLIAAFPQLALEGREDWEYAQAIPEYDHRDEVVAWNVGKSFHADPNRAPDEGYTLVRRALGPWSEVQS